MSAIFRSPMWATEMSDIDPMQRMLLMILFNHWLRLAEEGNIEELIEDLEKATTTLAEDK